MKVIEKLKKYLKEEIQENEDEMKRLEKEWLDDGATIVACWEDSYYQSVEIRTGQTKEILKKLEELEKENK